MVYHIVFATKYRNPALLNLKSEVYSVMDDLSKELGFKLLEQGLDNGDHLHLLVKVKPNKNLSVLVKKLKQYSTFNLYKSSERVEKTFYGSKRILWSSGYFIETVGNNEKNTIEIY